MTSTFAPVSLLKSGARRWSGSAICGPVNVTTRTVTPANGCACAVAVGAVDCDAAGVGDEAAGVCVHAANKRLAVARRASGLNLLPPPSNRRHAARLDGIPSRGTDIRRIAVLSSRPVGEGRAIARTAGRALDLLMFLVERGQNGLTARELAQMLGAPRTSVADLLKVLENRGFVAPTAEGHGWRLDFRVAQLGNAYLHEFSAREVGRAAMRELSRRTSLTTQMAVLDHSDIVYIERQDSSRRLGEPHVITDIGSRLPAYCTSLGKAMLAFLPDDEIDRLYGAGPLLPRTKNTITTVARLKSELAAIRRRGPCVDPEGATEGVGCVRGPRLRARGRAEAAISGAGLRAGLASSEVGTPGRAVARTASPGSSARRGARPVPKVRRAKVGRRKAALVRRRRVRGAA